jgi:hypothetical protein
MLPQLTSTHGAPPELQPQPGGFEPIREQEHATPQALPWQVPASPENNPLSSEQIVWLPTLASVESGEASDGTPDAVSDEASGLPVGEVEVPQAANTEMSTAEVAPTTTSGETRLAIEVGRMLEAHRLVRYSRVGDSTGRTPRHWLCHKFRLPRMVTTALSRRRQHPRIRNTRCIADRAGRPVESLRPLQTRRPAIRADPRLR